MELFLSLTNECCQTSLKQGKSEMAIKEKKTKLESILILMGTKVLKCFN